MKWRKGTLCLGAFLVLGAAAPAAVAGLVDYPAGSLIIPMDPCWQPNGDQAVLSAFRPTGCGTDHDDRGIFQAYGVVFELLKAEIPVAWAIKPDKSDRHALDFVIDGNLDGTSVAPAGTWPEDSAIPIDPPARTITWAGDGVIHTERLGAHVVDYRGGPFILHRNHLNEEGWSILAAFPGVRVHQARMPFSAPIAKVLDRLPSGLAVLGENNRGVLQDYLNAIGLGSAGTLNFEALTLARIADRSLAGEGFSLLWAPHWHTGEDGEGASPDQVLDRIAQFLAAGNSVLLGCATIPGVEGAEDFANPALDIGGRSAGSSGWLLTATTPAGGAEGGGLPGFRLVTGHETSPSGPMNFDSPENFLSQCAGWDFRPGPGRVRQFRPHQEQEAAGYHPTVLRLVHDGPGGSPPNREPFDYFVGGRILGGPALGMAAYLAGHRHLVCRGSGAETTDGQSGPAAEPATGDLALTLAIDGILPPGAMISLWVDYDGARAPVIGQFRADGSLTQNGDDAGLLVDLSQLTLDQQRGRTIAGNILISNLDPVAHTISRVLVDWSGCATPFGQNNAAAGQFRIAPEKRTGTRFCAAHPRSNGTVCEADRQVPLALAGGLEFAFEILEDLDEGELLNLEFGYQNGANRGSLPLVLDLTRAGARADGEVMVLPLASGSIPPGTGNHPLELDLSDLQVVREFQNPDRTRFRRLVVKGLKLKAATNSEPDLLHLKAWWGDQPSGCGEFFELIETGGRTITGQRKNLPVPVGRILGPLNGGGRAAEVPGEMAQAVSFCDPDWSRSNTCGTRFILNSLLGLQRPNGPGNLANNTAPAIDGDLLVVGAYQSPGQEGHLQAFDLSQEDGRPLWDAQDMMPPAGTGNPLVPTDDNASRLIFTNEGAVLVPFQVAAADNPSAYLHRTMGLATLGETHSWINTVRGRDGSHPAAPGGTGERSRRLGGVRDSTPALVGRMLLRPDARDRDRMAYVGADDGMLHAFHAGEWNPAAGRYSSGSGREIWAFLPSSLLPQLKSRNFTDPTAQPAVVVAGAPAVGDFFLPRSTAGSSRREWRTLLVGTAGVASENRGVCFALDITDPYDPRVLWERAFSDNLNLGLSRGAAIGPVQVGGEIRDWVFVTAGYRSRLDPDGNPALAGGGSNGINVVALDLLTGEPTWQFRKDYVLRKNVAGSPAIPALLDHDDNGVVDFLVAGDLDGRLWILRARDGNSVRRSGGIDLPAFPLPTEGGNLPDLGPIGSGVALKGDLALFATGGVDFADPDSGHGLHAVRIHGNGEVEEAWSAGLQDSGRSDFLQPGEKIRGTPVIDARGRIYLTTGQDGPVGRSGHIRILDLQGRQLSSLATQNEVTGGVAVSDGVALATDTSGQNYIIGRPSRGGGNAGVQVKVFSWRQR